ncbi:MAG TPA: Gmad2 immunoglobulin-like domain-containing protein [Gaiellales bacterium]
MTVRILVLVAACSLAAGCGGSGAVAVGPQSSPARPPVVSVAGASTSVAAPQPSSGMAVEVWLERGGRLWPAQRMVEPTTAVLGASVSALLAGATAVERSERIASAVPPETQLLGISLHGGVATVDLTSEFGVGSTGTERLRLAQLVFTVTGYPSVHGLRLHLNGQPVSALSDGLRLPDPITRTSMGFAGLVPPITVARPQPGGRVRAPFTVSGVADVFEAGLTYRLLDASGHELGSGSTSASCGTGCPGTFSFSIPEIGVSYVQPGTLVISSAGASGRPEGGEHVRLPLVLVPPFDVTTPKPGATLTNPALIAVRGPSSARVLLRIFDAHFNLLGHRVVNMACSGPCTSDATYTNHVRFSAPGLEQGYVVVSPAHGKGDEAGQVVEIPVTLNGG